MILMIITRYMSPRKDDAEGQKKNLVFVHTRDIYVERIKEKRIS